MVNRSSTKRQHEYVSSSEEELANEYQVEAILDKRIRGTRTQYLLKWKGYSNEDNTWEDENCLNCPELLKNYEKRVKKLNESRSKSRTTPRKKRSTRTRMTNEDAYDDNYASSNTDNNSDSILNQNNNNRIVTRHSKRQKTFSSGSHRRHSTRKVVERAKSRISLMSNDQISTDDDLQSSTSSGNKPEKKTTSNEQAITINDDSLNVNNNSIDLVEQSSPNEISINDSTTASLILRITPNSTSSISITRMDGDNSHTNENHPTTPATSEVIDETDQVEKIEAVRNKNDGISFRIKLINQSEPQWISSKIANQKYPQAVIAFWESHVQFV